MTRTQAMAYFVAWLDWWKADYMSGGDPPLRPMGVTSYHEGRVKLAAQVLAGVIA